MKKIAFILTAEFAVLAFLPNQLRALSKLYDVTVIVNTEDSDFLQVLGIDVKVIPLEINRKITPLSDVMTLVKLIQILREQKYDAIHTLMPKAGLLGGLAGAVLGVPVRVHTFTGQVWVTRSGFQKVFFKAVDWLIGKLTTINLVDGKSQLQFLIDQKVLSKDDSQVFLNGSIAGVDLQRFKPDGVKRMNIRNQLQIANDAIVFVYLGRLNQEKGVLELAQAFMELQSANVNLIYVGPDEEGMKEAIINICKSRLERLDFVDYTHAPEAYMAASDVVCLPSYREGFNNVVIEAAAVGIPAIASDIYGVRDAVIHQLTGLLHPVKNVKAIKQAMQIMIEQPDLRLKLGGNAKQHVAAHFDSKAMTVAWVKFYQQVLSN